MKKITIGFLAVIIIAFIIGIIANNVEPDQVTTFDFDGMTFTYDSTNQDAIDIYTSREYDMDVLVEETSMTTFFEKEDDIYLIETDYININIRVNGSLTSICSLDLETCSGGTSIGLEDDIIFVINTLK